MSGRGLMYGDHYRAVVVEVTTSCVLCDRLVRARSRAWEHVRASSARVVCGRCVDGAAREERRALAPSSSVDLPGQGDLW